MKKITLNAQTKDNSVKAKVLRRNGLLPGQFYGSGVENVSLQMDYQEFRKLYREAGENTIVDLKIEGVGDQTVLVHNVDYDPVTDAFVHVEFINVNMNEEVTTNVPITLEGQAPAVKELGGVLMQNLDELEIRCLPTDLISELVVNIDSLVDFHSSIHVSDITVPEKITIITDVSITVATVSAPREEEVELTDAPDVAGVEVDGETPEEGADAEKAEGGEKKSE